MRVLRLWPYMILLLALVGAILAYLYLPPPSEGPRGFTLNLATEIVGILLTVGLIDAVVRRREKRQQERFRSVALRQFWRPLNRHLTLLFNIYKASAERKPDREISQVRDLFDEDYVEQIKRFDVTSESPRSIGVGADSVLMPWFDYLSHEVTTFKDDLGRVVDKYATYLDPDTLDFAEQVIDSSFISILDFSPTIVAYARSEKGYEVRIPVFAGQGMAQVVSDYTNAFYRLVEIYNSEAASDKKVVVSQELWDNNLLPKIGSARLSKLPTDAEADEKD